MIRGMESLHAPQSPAKAQSAILLTDNRAAAALGISVRKFHELRHLLPPPVQLGPRCVRWIRSELEEAAASLPRQDRPVEPAQLLRGKIEAIKKRAGVRAPGGAVNHAIGGVVAGG